jgi:hypothetical protein
MKIGILSLLFLMNAIILSAQMTGDTTIVESKVQKKIFIVRKTDAKASLKPADEKLTENDIVKLISNQKSYKSLPKMISDKDGLLNQAILEQFDEKEKKEFNYPYAIMSITISKYGFISKIVVHDYSERALVDILINKFDQTYWKAAKDSDGVDVEYTYNKIAVIMPIVIKPENHED